MESYIFEELMVMIVPIILVVAGLYWGMKSQKKHMTKKK